MQLNTELRRYITLLRHWARVLMLAPVLAGALTFWFSSKQTPIYQAATIVLIDEALSTDGNIDYNALLTSERLARTYGELLTTGPLLNAVIERLRLPANVEGLRQALTITSGQDTQLLRIRVRDTDPQQAARIANALVTTFAEQIQQVETGRFADLKDNLQQQRATLDQQIQQTEASLAALGNTDGAAPARSQLEATLAQYRQSYSTILQSYEQVRLAEAQTTSSVVHVEPAVAPDQPISPRVLLNTLLAAVTGLLLASGMVFLQEALNGKVRGEELYTQLDVPVIGTIPRLGTTKHSPLIVVDQPHAPATEAFRALRTNLQFLGTHRPLRTIVITSPAPSAGTAHMIVNLATVFAQGGRNVVLVDADLRRPGLHKLLDVANGTGLSGLLRQPKDQLSVEVRQTLIDRVAVLTAGNAPAHHTDLINSVEMVGILRHLREHTDVVLINAPPVMAVTDAVVLAQRVDGVVLVVENGITKLSTVKQAVDQLRQVSAQIIGVVLHDASLRSFHYPYLPHDHPQNSDRHTYGQFGRVGAWGWARRNNVSQTKNLHSKGDL